jgi:hypothetical protein
VEKIGLNAVVYRMEGISSAASVIAIIQLTGSLMKLFGGYIQEVKDARADIISLQRTFENIEWTLQDLHTFLQRDDGKALSVSSRIANSITDCLTDLQTVEAKLDPGKGRNMMKKVGLRALKWPLKRAELESIIHNLERYKSLFLLALQVDQTCVCPARNFRSIC